MVGVAVYGMTVCRMTDHHDLQIAPSADARALQDDRTLAAPLSAAPTGLDLVRGYVEVDTSSDLWVFGYGSLMWRPGFAYVDRARAHLHGYHRAMCIYSHRHRGTADRPGLVLGLDRGGSCCGIAYRVAARDVADVVDYLWSREMSTRVYRPRRLALTIDGRRVSSLGFVADRRHDQYCSDRDVEVSARLIALGHGQSGPNHEYLENTLVHLDEMGIADHHLAALLRTVNRLRANGFD